MLRSHHPIIVLLLAGVALLVAWQVAPLPSPPLYDGVQIPEEPYRYLNPPPSAISHLPPRPVQERVPAASAARSTLALATTEKPAQARFIVLPHGLDVPPGAGQIDLSIRAVPTPRSPGDGHLDGNVYLFSVQRGGAALSLRGSQSAVVLLRGTNSDGTAILEQYSGGRWHRRPTTYFGSNDYYSTHVSTFGYFALVTVHGVLPAQGDDKTVTIVVFLANIAAVLLFALFVAVRLIRRRRTA